MTYYLSGAVGDIPKIMLVGIVTDFGGDTWFVTYMDLKALIRESNPGDYPRRVPG